MKQIDTKETYINKITDMTGISRSTIFRYLAGNQVRIGSQKKIEKAIEMLEGGEKESAPFEIIVSINTPDFDIFKGNSEILSGILEESSAHALKMSLQRDVPPGKKENAGFIIVGKHGEDLEKDIARLEELGVPFVVINRMIGDPRVSYVAADNKACGAEMASHLIEKGCKRIALWGENRTRVARDKAAGYAASLTSHGLSLEPELIEHDVENHPLEESFKRFMSLTPPADAIMTLDDETALKVTRLALTNGYRIPEDLLVSGMNDMDSSANVVPSLTSIRIDFRKLGKKAVHVLQDLMADRELQSEKIVIGHRLMMRDSTRR